MRSARHHARVDAQALERILQRQRVHDGGEHAHVIGRDPVHAGARQPRAAKDVATAEHHRHLHAQLASGRGSPPAMRLRIAGSMP